MPCLTLAVNFLQTIGAMLRKPVFSGLGGQGGYGWMHWGRGGYDYRAEAGPLHENSIITSCLNWERKASAEVPLCIQRLDANGKWAAAPRHRANVLLRRPNGFYPMRHLLNAVRWDFHLSGNAYLHKIRNGGGQVIQLLYLPSWMVIPCWDPNGTAFISGYRYTVNGEMYALPVSDVIHFRNGIDPESSGRMGLSDFHATLREVCSDNEASVFLAATMRNMGVPGVIISPKTEGAKMPPEARSAFKKMWQESFTGERRGEPFVQSIPVDVTVPGWNPQQMVLDKVRAIPEQRIAGNFGIPMSVLQLGSGIENSNSRANKGDDREQAYESCIIPTMMELAATLTDELLCEYPDADSYRVWTDLTQVRCLQGDEDALAKRLVVAAGGPYMTPNEARLAAGLAALADGDTLRTQPDPTNAVPADSNDIGANNG